MDYIAIIDTETNWNDQVMSIGIVIADAKTYELKDEKYFVLSPEYTVGGMFADALMAYQIPNAKECSRSEALEEIVRWLRSVAVDSLYAYNASFDMNHLCELSNYKWFDIMRLAAYKQYNDAITEDAECCKTGRLKRNYGVEAIIRLMTRDSHYCETHNALKDAEDELNIMRMLKRQIGDYQCALCRPQKANNSGKISTNSIKVELKTADVMGNSEKEFEDRRIPQLSQCENVNNASENLAGMCSALDAANILGVSKSTVYSMIKRGDIYARKKGNKYLINIDSINHYIEAKKAAKKRARIISMVFVGVFLAFVLWGYYLL